MAGIKKNIIPFLKANAVLLIFTFVFQAWMSLMYVHEWFFNILVIFGIAITLSILYPYLLKKMDLGKWNTLLLIPILPYIPPFLLVNIVWYHIFPYPSGDDNFGAGIMMMMISFLHYGVIFLSVMSNKED